MKEDMNPREGMPELGTREAALEGCVDLIARMCGQSEDIVRYWLELYFQTRLAYAVEEDRRRREAQLIERVPQVFGAPKEEAQQPEQAAPAPQDQVQEEAPPVKPTSGLEGFEPVAPNKGGAPRGNTNGSDAAKFKREVLARLMRMRGDGLTIERIVRESKGNLTDDVVLNILQARKMSISYYRKLAAALDRIEA